MIDRRAAHQGAPADDGPIYADSFLVVTRTHQPDGLRFSGEIDINNSSAVAEALRRGFPNGGDHHIDLRSLLFCDISGIRAFVDAGRELEPGHQLRLHGLPKPLERVMQVTGWSDLPWLAMCTCTMDQE
ncbi:MAG TPA: STAS domain-containing protein [Candidatus Dormibacteraeota bacterium]|nr:STAS domain-containing protein [Candidatus Dormibacteraeota bacterium]